MECNPYVNQGVLVMFTISKAYAITKSHNNYFSIQSDIQKLDIKI